MVAVKLGDDAEAMGAGALNWMLATARDTSEGLWWPRVPSSNEEDASLYGGTAGVVLALLEGARHFDDDRYAQAALSGARRLAFVLDTWEHESLYAGAMGMAVALRSVEKMLGDVTSGASVDRALDIVRQRFNGTSWDKWFELLLGNAGISLAALHLGDLDLAVLAAEPYLSAVVPTPHGLSWYRVSDGSATELLHHVSHGTLGIAHSLAAVGQAAGRADMMDAATAGINDVIARNEAGDDGFLVPHSDPQRNPTVVSRYNYGWCHGPAGDAHVFRFLHQVTNDPNWRSLADRCWHSIIISGLPQRLHPGFWDNNGRCCGTAGVLALACDRIVERGDDPGFANHLVADLASHAVTDAAGTRWSNLEHRADPPILEPHIGWAHGNAGIIRELLRYARITRGEMDGYAVSLPDHPTANAERKSLWTARLRQTNRLAGGVSGTQSECWSLR